MKKAESRKDILEDLMIATSKSRETLELKCEKKDCEYEWADRL